MRTHWKTESKTGDLVLLNTNDELLARISAETIHNASHSEHPTNNIQSLVSDIEREILNKTRYDPRFAKLTI